jgi:hypothetical protein
LEKTIMGDTDEQQLKQRHRAIEELRSHSVGRLITIVDMLAAMDLSAREIENVLRTCGLNEDCAMRFGADITTKRGNDNDHGERPMHP